MAPSARRKLTPCLLPSDLNWRPVPTGAAQIGVLSAFERRKLKRWRPRSRGFRVAGASGATFSGQLAQGPFAAMRFQRRFPGRRASRRSSGKRYVRNDARRGQQRRSMRRTSQLTVHRPPKSPFAPRKQRYFRGAKGDSTGQTLGGPSTARERLRKPAKRNALPSLSCGPGLDALPARRLSTAASKPRFRSPRGAGSSLFALSA